MTGLSIVVAVLCLAALVWIIAGYPLALAALAQRKKPIRKEWKPRTVSIIVVVRDGRHYIGAKLKSLLALDYPKELLDITVASDGSIDGTDDIVREFAPQGVRLVCCRRGGKPAALNSTIPTTAGEILVLTDVRQLLERDSVRELVSCLADPAVGVVSGTVRIRDGASQAEADVGNYWTYETWIRKNLSRLDSIFGATGPLYAIRRELVVRVPDQILLDDVYLPLEGFFRGYRLVVEEKAVAVDYATTLDVEFRRKVRTLGGNYQLLRHYPALLGPSNRMWVHYMSYKFGRLMLPLALICLAAASTNLPEPWGPTLIGGQSLFYFLAAVDAMLPEGFALKRVSSPCRTFVVMMAAALCACAVFFVEPGRLWSVTSSRQLGPITSDDEICLNK